MPMPMNMTMYMMPMHFSFNTTNIYLFYGLKSDSLLGYLLWLVGIVLVSFGVQTLEYARTQYHNKQLRELAIQEKIATT